MMSLCRSRRSAAVVCAVGLLLTPAAQAVTCTGTATLVIVSPLSVAEQTQAHFGAITPPTFGEQTYSLSAITGRVTSGDEADGEVMDASGRAGVFLIHGVANLAVTVTARIQPFDAGSITVDSTEIFARNAHALGGGSLEANLDGAGGLSVQIGGVIRVSPGEPEGWQSAQVTLTVVYQ